MIIDKYRRLEKNKKCKLPHEFYPAKIIRRTFNEKTRATDELSAERPHPAAKGPFQRIRRRQFAELLAEPGLLEEAIS